MCVTLRSNGKTSKSGSKKLQDQANTYEEGFQAIYFWRPLIGQSQHWGQAWYFSPACGWRRPLLLHRGRPRLSARRLRGGTLLYSVSGRRRVLLDCACRQHGSASLLRRSDSRLRELAIIHVILKRVQASDARRLFTLSDGPVHDGRGSFGPERRSVFGRRRSGRRQPLAVLGLGHRCTHTLAVAGVGPALRRNAERSDVLGLVCGRRLRSGSLLPLAACEIPLMGGSGGASW